MKFFTMFRCTDEKKNIPSDRYLRAVRKNYGDTNIIFHEWFLEGRVEHPLFQDSSKQSIGQSLQIYELNNGRIEDIFVSIFIRDSLKKWTKRNISPRIIPLEQGRGELSRCRRQRWPRDEIIILGVLRLSAREMFAKKIGANFEHFLRRVHWTNVTRIGGALPLATRIPPSLSLL